MPDFIEPQGFAVRPAEVQAQFDAFARAFGRPMFQNDAAIQEPAAPPELPDKYIVIDGEGVFVPAWTKFVTQNKKGTIEAWSHVPHQLPDRFNMPIGAVKHKVIMKIPEYDVICLPC